MKKTAAGFITGFITALSITVLAGTQIRLIINGADITGNMDVKPRIIDGRVMVPARFVAEGLGAEVFWDEENQSVVVDSVIQEPHETLPDKTIVLEDASIIWKEDNLNNCYVGNINTNKFHDKYCPEVLKMNYRNIELLYSIEEALESGYVECKKCNPQSAQNQP